MIISSFVLFKFPIWDFASVKDGAESANGGNGTDVAVHSCIERSRVHLGFVRDVLRSIEPVDAN